jgi:hypothetical protein
VAIPKVIDIDDGPLLPRSITAIREGHEPMRLRRAGEDLAVVTPVYANSQYTALLPIKTAEDLAVFLSLAGGWADTDTDASVENLYRQRLVSTRPPIDL